METTELIETCAKDLSDEQEAAFRDLVDKLLEPGTAQYTLQGYAGTGKTFVAARICQVLQAEKVDVVAAAPTHRATAELRRAIATGESFGDEPIPTRTLPSLLGLQLRADGRGEYHLVPAGDSKLPETGVVICDEGSMVGEETMEHIEASGQGVRWLFLGDPAQLPPVGEEPSAVFDLPGSALQTIVRQARDNPIIDFTRRIREGEPHLGSAYLTYDDGMGVAATRSPRAFQESAVRLFASAEFEDDPHTGRILAYRNAVVDRYNKSVRAAIHGADAPSFVEGEWLVARETWVPEEFPVIINSEVLKVLEAEKGVDSLALGGEWSIWRLKVQPEDRNSCEIMVLADEEWPRYREAMERYKTQALTATKNRDRNTASSSWDKFYRLKEQYAEVGYAYATTVHKSQGGTFDSVFVDYRDLDRSREPERSALKYVAGTRPRQRLALLI